MMMRTSTNTRTSSRPRSRDDRMRATALTDPGHDCPRCPRLVEFRNHWRGREAGWFNAPVPTFGADNPRFLIVGLAPGLKGANRTGRPFTGDFAGDLLYQTLVKFGFATGDYEARPDDSLQLIDTAITNAVRCVPPQNKPTGPEIAACRPFLAQTIADNHELVALLALGRIAHDSVVRTLGLRLAAWPFSHGACHELDVEREGGGGAPGRRRALRLYDSYHCSRYNTNTGRLTTDMFEAVIADIAAMLKTGAADT